MMYQKTTIHDLTERCRSTKYPVIKLGLHEHGPFRRLNLGQEHDDLLYDLHCRAIEMYIHQAKDASCGDDDAQTICTLCTLQKSLIDYSLYTVLLKYQDKDGEDCMIFNGMEVVDAINEHQGSSNFKVIAQVREKGKQEQQRPIGRIVSLCHDIINNNTAVERRDDKDSSARDEDDRADGTRNSIDMVESRDGCMDSSHPGKGDVSVLTEHSSRKIVSLLLTKSIFGFRRRKQQRGTTTQVQGVASIKSADGGDDASSVVSSPVGKTILHVHLFDDDCGIGASYTETNTRSLPDSHHE
jgi:hypothetical protein